PLTRHCLHYSLPILHRYSCVLHIIFLADTATTEIYTLSLHDALPIFRRLLEKNSSACGPRGMGGAPACLVSPEGLSEPAVSDSRSEEHTSELQSRENLVCRLLLEKKKNTYSETRSDKEHTRTGYT